MIKHGVVIEVRESDGAQCVQVGSQPHEVEWMKGISRIEGAEIGDRVRLTYRSTRSYGLWIGEKSNG